MLREKSTPYRKALNALLILLFLSSCTPDEPDSPSPDLLAQFIHDKNYVALEKTLQQLEVESPQQLIDFIKEGDSPLGERTSLESISVKVNNHSEYSLLLIKANYWRRYLVFKFEAEKWKFFGEFDQVNHLRDTTHRMVTDDRGNAWLVIRYVMGHGTGVFSYGEAWYSLNGKKLEEALVYAVETSIAGPSPQYPAVIEIKGDAYYYTAVTDRRFHVEVTAEAVYSDHQGHPLFRMDRTEYYIWSPAANRFLPNMEISATALNNAARRFPYSRDEFLDYAYEELLELAKNGGKTQKQWVQQVLSATNDSAKKEILLEALNSQ